MTPLETTTVGERGQIVIPKKLRDELKLRKGQHFTVEHVGAGIYLEPILNRPPRHEFEELLRRGSERAARMGLTEQDMWDAIEKYLRHERSLIRTSSSQASTGKGRRGKS